jgi:hypothetical protein
VTSEPARGLDLHKLGACSGGHPHEIMDSLEEESLVSGFAPTGKLLGRGGEETSS